MALQSRCLCCIPNPHGTSWGTRGWRMLEKPQGNSTAEMLNSQQGTETRFASQTLSPLGTQREKGLQQLQGAEKRVGGSWWVTGEELVGSGWWKMFWKILGVFQCGFWILHRTSELFLPFPDVEAELGRRLQQEETQTLTTKNGPEALDPWNSSCEPACINEAIPGALPFS